MKKVFFLLSPLLLLVAANAQATDTWKLLLNNKVVAQGKSDRVDSSAHLKASLLKKTDKIVLTYATTNANSAWNRTFYINDVNDSTMLTLRMNKPAGSVVISAATLKNIIAKEKSFYIYTISLPKDPSLAARVRVARVLLGKIEWN